MARVYDKEAGLWVEYKPKILPNIELPLNAKCKLGNLVMDDESVVYNILKLNAKLVKVETPGLSIQLLKKIDKIYSASLNESSLNTDIYENYINEKRGILIDIRKFDDALNDEILKAATSKFGIEWDDPI